jgi:predicted PurR-regulated permease PerM
VERLVAPVLFLALVLTLGYAFILVLSPFLGALAWASVLAIAVQPIFVRLVRRITRGKAALLTTLGVALAFIVPAGLLLTKLAGECVTLATRLAQMDPATRAQAVQAATDFWAGLQQRVPPLRNVDLMETVNAGAVKLSRQIASAAGIFAQSVAGFVVLAVLVLLALYFLLRDGPALVAWLRRLSPLRAELTDRLFEEIRALTEGSVTAMLLIAAVQGTLGGIAAAIAGLPSAVIWGAAFAVCSFIPVVGPALVWIPGVLFLVVTGHHGRAAAMLLMSVLVVAQVDNLIRPIFVSGRSRLSFEVSMLSVLGGMAAFGMLGLVLGPVVVVMLTAILDVYLQTKPAAATAPQAELP